MYGLFIAILLFVPPQAPLPLQSPPLVEPARTYADAYADAIETNKPLIAFVNSDYRNVSGCVTVKTKALEFAEGSITAGIVVSRPVGGILEYVTTLGAGASDSEILRAVKGVSRQAAPFGRNGSSGKQSARLTADADEAIRSLRRVAPELAEYLAALEQYQSATKTQVTFRRVTGYIAPADRSLVEERWNVPGGLLGVRGWTSALFRSQHRPRVFLARQSPYSDVDAVTWYREYPNGTTFADVLQNDAGEVFEARIAEKRGGKWDRYVAYRNAAHRPAGYLPPKRSACESCHSQTGIAVYGGAAIPGGDGVFSDPYHHLEAGQTVQFGNGLSLE